eukprot:scaffold81520_cov48-Phaeocystis_antarctica.AAC.2
MHTRRAAAWRVAAGAHLVRVGVWFGLGLLLRFGFGFRFGLGFGLGLGLGLGSRLGLGLGSGSSPPYSATGCEARSAQRAKSPCPQSDGATNARAPTKPPCAAAVSSA